MEEYRPYQGDDQDGRPHPWQSGRSFRKVDYLRNRSPRPRCSLRYRQHQTPEGSRLGTIASV